MILISDGDDNQSRVYLPRPSRSASARRPSSTPSAPTGRRAAARATRCCSNWPRKPAAKSSSHLRSKRWRQLQKHRRGIAQPVRADLHAGGFQGRTARSEPSISIQRPPLLCSRQGRLLRSPRLTEHLFRVFRLGAPVVLRPGGELIKTTFPNRHDSQESLPFRNIWRFFPRMPPSFP